MSRNVPLDRALENEDRRYLRNLGAHGSHLEKRIDTEFPPDPEKLSEFNLEERKRHSAINGTGLNASDQDLLVAENERLRAELAALQNSSPPPSNVPDYTGWTKAQLETEIDRINSEDPEAKLAKGKVAEMVSVLSDYFVE